MPIGFDPGEVSPEFLKNYYAASTGMPWQAPKEEFLRDPANRIRVEILVDEICATTPSTALDAGCGSGILASIIAEKLPSCSVSGVDIAPLARPVPGVNFKTADIAALPFTDNSFDAVVCSEVLEHLFNPAEAAREIARVLSPGGSAFITVPNLFSLDSIDGATGAVSAFYRAASRARGGDKVSTHTTHITRMSPKRWKGLLEANGLSVASDAPVYLFPYIPYFLKVAKRAEFSLFASDSVVTTWREFEKRAGKLPLLKIAGQFHFFRCVKKELN